jgi:protoporphyrinogen oxidase
VRKTLFRPSDAPRGLVTEFIYPRHGGIGEIARGYARELEALGATVITGAPVTRAHRDGNRIVSIDYGGDAAGSIETDEIVSTIPITALARAVRPAAPPEVLDGISQLTYASIIFVYVKLAKPTVTPDSWMYLPESRLTIHRISEFKNFSPHCAPPDKTMVCAEITCRVGDEHWRASDEELAQIAVDDLQELGFVAPHEVLGTFVRKIPYAYPIYDLQYKEHLGPVLDFIHTLENVKTGGRQGLFRYNNMDQSIEMGRRMAWTLLSEQDAGHEAVATESEYFG